MCPRNEQGDNRTDHEPEWIEIIAPTVVGLCCGVLLGMQLATTLWSMSEQSAVRMAETARYVELQRTIHLVGPSLVTACRGVDSTTQPSTVAYCYHLRTGGIRPLMSTTSDQGCRSGNYILTVTCASSPRVHLQYHR